MSNKTDYIKSAKIILTHLVNSSTTQQEADENSRQYFRMIDTFCILKKVKPDMTDYKMMEELMLFTGDKINKKYPTERQLSTKPFMNKSMEENLVELVKQELEKKLDDVK